MRATPQDAFNHIAEASADQQLSLVAVFDAHLDADVLRRAVAELVSVEPVLACRYVPDGRHPLLESVGNPPDVTVTEVPDPRAAALALAAERLDAETGPVLRVRLARGPASDSLVMTLHHVAADGQGAKAVFALLAETYSALAAGKPAALQPAGDRGQGQVLRRVGPFKLLRALRERKAWRPTWGMPALGEAQARTFALLQLRPSRFAEVKAYGKERGATVNDVLVTAFYRALFAVLEPAPDRPMAVNVSFDLRRYLPAGAGAAACNLSSVEPLGVAYKPEEPFEDTLACVREQMAAYKAGLPGLGSAVLLEAVWRLGGYARVDALVGEPMRRGKGYGLSFPFLSNFGILPEDRLCFAGALPAELMVLPPASLPPFLMLGVSTWRDSVTLAVGYPPDAMDPSLVARLLATLDSELPGAAGQGAAAV